MFDETNLKSAHKQAIIVSVAFFFSLIVYTGLAEFFLASLRIEIEPSVLTILNAIFILLSMAEAGLMMFLKNRILEGKTKISMGMESETGEWQFIQRLRSAHIITYALSEAIALQGLIIYILGKTKTAFYAFLGICVFMMIVNFPRYDDWKSRLEDFLSDMGQ